MFSNTVNLVGMIVCVLMLILSVVVLYRARFALRIGTIVFILTWLVGLGLFSSSYWLVRLYPDVHRWRDEARQAIRALEEGRQDEAISSLRAAIEKMPQATSLRLTLAGALERTGQREAAIEEYKAILRLDDTGSYSMDARKALRKLGGIDPALLDPIRAPVDLPATDEKTMAQQVGPLGGEFIKVLQWGMYMNMAFYSLLIWFIYMALRADPNMSATWLPSGFLLWLFLLSACLAHYVGTVVQDWYTVMSGWVNVALIIQGGLSMTGLLLIRDIVFRIPRSTLWLLLLVVVILIPDTIIHIRKGESSQVAFGLAQAVSFLACLWGMDLLAGMGYGRLAGSPLLAWMTRNIVTIGLVIIVPLTAHALCLFKVAPWLAVRYDMTMPAYFWNAGWVKWLNGCLG